MPFLIDQLAQLAKKQPDRPALENGHIAITYGQLYQQICAASNSLQRSCTVPKDRIAIVCNKSVETIIMIYACWMSDRCAVLINPALRTDQIAHIIENSEARILLTDVARYQRAYTRLASASSLQEIVLTNHSTNNVDFQNYKKFRPSLWASYVDPQFRQEPDTEALDEQSLACLLYTSGSTGLPKGVMISHQNLYLGVKSVCKYLNSHTEDRILAVLPLSFDYGLNQVTQTLFTGATVILYDYLLAGDLLQTLSRKSITGLAGIPTLWHAITDIQSNTDEFLSLRYITNSGGKLSPSLMQKLQKLFVRAQIFSMYGTTEAFRSTYLPPSEIGRRPNSIGKAIPYAELHVLDKEMNPCKPGVTGELVHAGPLVTLGYWQRDSSTQEDGYSTLPKNINSVYPPGSRIFRTGDLGYIDDEGYFYFRGRKDEMIKTSGFRVSPTEVEMIALQAEGVRQAVAIGHIDEQFGQTILLVVNTDQEQSLIKARIEKCFLTQAPPYMRPGVIVVIDHMPLTPNGKPDRNQVRQQIYNLEDLPS